jgi:hypothetical protein
MPSSGRGCHDSYLVERVKFTHTDFTILTRSTRTVIWHPQSEYGIPYAETRVAFACRKDHQLAQ